MHPLVCALVLSVLQQPPAPAAHEWTLFASVTPDNDQTRPHGPTHSKYVLDRIELDRKKDVLRIQGDGWAALAGIQRRIKADGWTRLSFTWRAASSLPNSQVTNAFLRILDAKDETLLHHESLVVDPTDDTGWKCFDRVFIASRPRDIVVQIHLADSWIADWGQKLFVHDPAWKAEPPPAIGDELHREIARLVANLGHPDLDVREEAEELLEKIGAAALPAVQEAMRHPAEEVRGRAARVLQTLGRGPVSLDPPNR